MCIFAAETVFPAGHAYYKGIPYNKWVELSDTIKKEVGKYYDKSVIMETRQLMADGKLSGEFSNLYSGKITITGSNIENAVNHLPGCYKTIVLDAVKNIDKWEKHKQNQPKTHESQRSKNFNVFNYYTLNVNGETLIINVGVNKFTGNEILYAITTDNKKTK